MLVLVYGLLKIRRLSLPTKICADHWRRAFANFCPPDSGRNLPCGDVWKTRSFDQPLSLDLQGYSNSSFSPHDALQFWVFIGSQVAKRQTDIVSELRNIRSRIDEADMMRRLFCDTKSDYWERLAAMNKIQALGDSGIHDRCKALDTVLASLDADVSRGVTDEVRLCALYTSTHETIMAAPHLSSAPLTP